MIVRKRSAGDNVEAKCTRCRAVLNHTIVAMVGERIVRVQCNTCGGQHNYHQPQEEKKPVERSASQRSTSRTPSAGRPRREPIPKGPSEWELSIEGVDPDTATPYAMDRPFRTGEVVSHPVFGIGIVVTVTKPNKVEILFKDGVKLLRCAL
ncbi:hypothetical protein KI811_09195 [Geobacter hydrogenophilus]|uniref:Uncharacterized protein n=1 Tax=Geobacter hydrogenophilus TaxID=40983 RepID=A0A9W6LBL5_9BACT|nr:hypothetical protein [Geobacter hydrogenophilus]MBT0893985.1 hypothetical protein [Geobacter hydrogenophilus]GLI38068.1 hypothetical protein GHYDROH2_15690 [Geobacter hydrogenophilus]